MWFKIEFIQLFNFLLMKSFKLFAFKRKFRILYPIEVFFKMHSRATERKKGKKWVQKTNFLANEKSLNDFIVKKQLHCL